jgi:hypothetical protein
MACLRNLVMACSAAPGPSTSPLPSVTTPATRPTLTTLGITLG